MNLHYLKNKKTITKPESLKCDIFISAFNDNERVQNTFNKIKAEKKYWVVLAEYDYQKHELPTSGETLTFTSRNEGEVISDLINLISQDALKNKICCIDITGFLRPCILSFAQMLKSYNIPKAYFLYTEPEQYGKKENTIFTRDVSYVRQVVGYEGIHTDDVAHDYLILGMGYDDELISRVAGDKDAATVVQLLSLPSLSADMYQESVLRLDKSSIPTDAHLDRHVFFAPANDPFVVASELSAKYKELLAVGNINNLYLSPLATKPQTLGFALFYLRELQSKAASIIFPFSKSYYRETSKGFGKTWLYEVDM